MEPRLKKVVIGVSAILLYILVTIITALAVPSHCSESKLDSFNVRKCGNVTLHLHNGMKVEWSGQKAKMVAKFLHYALNYTFEDASAEISYYHLPDLRLVFKPNLTAAYLFDQNVTIADLHKLYDIIEEC